MVTKKRATGQAKDKNRKLKKETLKDLKPKMGAVKGGAAAKQTAWDATRVTVNQNSATPEHGDARTEERSVSSK